MGARDGDDSILMHWIVKLTKEASLFSKPTLHNLEVRVSVDDSGHSPVRRSRRD